MNNVLQNLEERISKAQIPIITPGSTWFGAKLNAGIEETPEVISPLDRLKAELNML